MATHTHVIYVFFIYTLQVSSAALRPRSPINQFSVFGIRNEVIFLLNPFCVASGLSVLSVPFHVHLAFGP